MFTLAMSQAAAKDIIITLITCFMNRIHILDVCFPVSQWKHRITDKFQQS